MLKNKKIRVIVVVILSLFLIGGASMVIIKGVEHLRIEKQKRQKAESIKESKKEVKEQAKARQKIALWVVQHFEGAEPIKLIEVGHIESLGAFGTGGESTSVRINGQNKNSMGLQLDPDSNLPIGFDKSKGFEYAYIQKTKKTLDGVEVRYWG